MPRGYLDYERQIKNLEAREDDIWISSFPKCGTTWTQEMVWNIMNGVDIEQAKKTKLDQRIPFLELCGLFDASVVQAIDEEEKLKQPEVFKSVEFVENLPTSKRRIIKTHLSHDMLPDQVREQNCKIIYVTRNPRDAVVSFYNHFRVLEGFQGEI